MSGRPILKGSTDQSTIIRIVDVTDGTPETGVVAATSGLDLRFRREGGTLTALSEADLSALDAAHSDGGLLHILTGYYRVDLPDSAVASGANGVWVGGSAASMVVIGTYHPLVDYNPYDGIRLGLTALPAQTPGGSGGLPTVDSSNRVGGVQTITDTNLDATLNTYQAKVWMFDDSGNDRYVVVWHKNGQPLTSGITSPTVQVIKAVDGTDLVASAAMTQIASTGLYRYDEGTNRIVDGVAYIIKAQASIDSGTRTWYQPVGRDA